MEKGSARTCECSRGSLGVVAKSGESGRVVAKTGGARVRVYAPIPYQILRGKRYE